MEKLTSAHVNGKIRKSNNRPFRSGSGQTVFLGGLLRSQPVICKRLLNHDDEIFREAVYQNAMNKKLVRWKDTDSYTKRLFANLSLYGLGEPRSMTLRLNKSYVDRLSDPVARVEARNLICDTWHKAMNKFGEEPLFWFVIEPEPTPHLHGGFILSHTAPEIFRKSLKCLRAPPNNSLETPLQSNTKKKYGVDSRYKWVEYTAKYEKSIGFQSVTTHLLKQKAMMSYETLRENQKNAAKVLIK